MRVEVIAKRADFLKARAGTRISAPDFTLNLHERDDDEERGALFRYGLTVTKKTGNAVERNRIKRRMRAVMRSIPLPLALAGFDAVFFMRRSAMTRSFDALGADVGECLFKARNRARQRSGDADVAKPRANGQKRGAATRTAGGT